MEMDFFFLKKNHKGTYESTSQHCQESEPGNDSPPKKRKGKSIIFPESRILYPDIGDIVFIRKSVRSCTKPLMSYFISYLNLSHLCCLHFKTVKCRNSKKVYKLLLKFQNGWKV